MNDDLKCYQEVADLAWALRCSLSFKAICKDNREKLEAKIQEVEALAWKLEKEIKEARRDAVLDKEFNMADKVGEVGIAI